MEYHDIVDRYDNLPVPTLIDLAKERGILPNHDINRKDPRLNQGYLTRRLVDLDTILDRLIQIFIYHDTTTQIELLYLADNLGFDDDIIPQDEVGIYNLLRQYVELNIDTLLMTPSGLNRYRYFQDRLNRDKENRLTPPRLEQRNITPPRLRGMDTGVPQTPQRPVQKTRRRDNVARVLTFDDEPVILTPQRYPQNIPDDQRITIEFNNGLYQVPSEDEINHKMTIEQLKTFLDTIGVSHGKLQRKVDYIQRAQQMRTLLLQTPDDIRADPIMWGRTIPADLRRSDQTKKISEENLRLTRGTKRVPATPIEEAIDESVDSLYRQALYQIKYVGTKYSPNELVEHITHHGFYELEDYGPNDPIELIMRDPDTLQLTRQVFGLLGLFNLIPEADYPTMINLIWNLYAERDEKTNYPLTRPLMTQSLLELRRRFPQLRTIPDLLIPPLLFRGRRGFVAPKPNVEALLEMNMYSPYEITKIVRYLYRRRRQLQPGEYIPKLSYYDKFTQRAPSPLIPFILEWKEGTSPLEISSSLGMIFPPSIDLLSDEIKYFLDNIEDYEKIYTRPNPIEPPPMLEDIPLVMVKDILAQYTDDELLGAYEVNLDDWKSRSDFLDRIATESKGAPKWSFRNRKCNNLDRADPLTLDEPKQDDPTDPLISYGTLTNYRCYNVSELTGNFKDDPETGFFFGVPDWVNPNLKPDILKTFKYPLPPFREFPVSSIKQLKRLIEGMNDPAFVALRDKINQGLAAKNNITSLMNQLRQQYFDMSAEDQGLVSDYILFLFLLGMYMRFWKGPGFPFPTEWIENGGGQERCEIKIRDEHTKMMFGVRSELLLQMKPSTEEWVVQLPRLRYDFQTGAVSLGREKIDYVIQEAQNGQFCLAEASDHMLRTAYYLALKILNLDNDGFNNALRQILQTPNQPPFEPNRVTESGHVDIEHHLNEEDSEEDETTVNRFVRNRPTFPDRHANDVN